MIIRKEIFNFQGKTYDNLKQIENEIQNNLGHLIDKLTNDGSFSPKHTLFLMKQILKHKYEFVTILNDSIECDFELEDNLRN